MHTATDKHATQWLARGVEELFETLKQDKEKDKTKDRDDVADEDDPALYQDVIIVGSGYGGAIAAATLAGTFGADGEAVRVCVLERGREYLPGTFPSSAATLPGHVRWSSSATPAPQGNRRGLFDIRLGPDINALVANGLGGGSLINAGVMLQPDAKALARLKLDSADLQACFDDARVLLDTPAGNTIERHARHGDGAGPKKFHALQDLSARMPGGRFSPVPLSVSMKKGINSAGIEMDPCIECGDCATGCNHNAKLSLDTNLLVKAVRQGANIYTGATVLKLAPTRLGWCLHVVYTDELLRRRHPSAFRLYARKVILSAGTFGSTEILLRSRSDALQLPSSLGQRFSGNGDMIAVAYDYPSPANAVADDRHAPDARQVGPTITARIDTAGAGGASLCFQEMAVPAALRRVFEEMTTTAAVLHHMGRIDWERHDPEGADPCAVNATAIRHSSLLAAMGDDGASGELELVGDDCAAPGDGAIRVRWPGLREHPLFQQQIDAIPVAHKETVLPNPSWRLLSKEMEQMIEAKRGPLTTVHPLGGCAIGERGNGVVNQHGQVWLAAGSELQDTLVVLDGAILPGALGVNPALTIAALALRAARRLRSQWNWIEADGPPPQQDTHTPRQPVQATAAEPAPTVVEVVERLGGAATLRRIDGSQGRYRIELTLRYAQRDVAELALPQKGAVVPLRRTQQVDPLRSTVAVYELEAWRRWIERREGAAAGPLQPVAQAALGGTLDFLQREKSAAWQRMLRGALAWARNRAGRDIWQELRLKWTTRALFHRAREEGDLLTYIARRVRGLAALASRAGEVRRFDYRLQVKEPIGAGAEITLTLGAPILGAKRLTYACLSNPLTQLTELALTGFPGMRGSATLTLDTDFLVEEDAPLLRVVGQQDQPTALLDVAGLGACLARVMLNIHLWTFRKPDPPRARTPQRLPGTVAGLPDPQVTDVAVDQLPDGTPVYARLTRYQRAGTTLPAVLLIHGYSTSGTSFSHPKVNPNLAAYLWERGRDVWVLDLRTSSGMPFATRPWSFEDVALADIPAAIDHVCRATGQEQLDVMAHCMGAAMTGMAVLAQLKPGARFNRERELLPLRIRRLVLSQVGPLVVFTQANVFRAYLMSYVRNLLPRVHYRFRVEGEPTLGDELLDRLLSALPYPRDELAIENPWWPFADTGFVGTRHRMDALYGRDFSLVNVGRNVLDNLDDFFGPLNLSTVSQSIHFARRKTITNRAGRNVYVSRKSLETNWIFPTLSIHGQDNGLSSVATLRRMESVLKDAGCRIETRAFPGMGHQDSWLGREAVDVFAAVAHFLSQPEPVRRAMPPSRPKLVAHIPAAGPVWTGQAAPATGPAPEQDLFSVLCDPVLPGASHVLCVPVEQQGERYVYSKGMQAGCVEWQVDPDDDGWMRMSRKAEWIGTAGTLVLVVYNDSPVVGNRVPYLSNFSTNRRGNSALRNRPWFDSLAGIALRYKVFPAQRTSGMSAKVRDALEDALRRPVEHLRQGVLAPPRPLLADDQCIMFAVGSCQYPGGPLDSVPAYRSYARLERRIEDDPVHAPAFVVLAGDQIYSDASAGLFDPAALDDRYKRPYEKLYANPHVRAVLRQRPAYMLIDDHEIADNWEPQSDPAGRDAQKAALDGYRKYQRAFDADGPSLWYMFEAGRVKFFMCDTRTERENRSLGNIGKARIINEKQRKALESWLLREPTSPKFVVSPSVLGLRRRDLVNAGDAARLYCDGWEGYPASMQRLLFFICKNGIENVTFLSGDEHLSCDMTIRLFEDGVHKATIRSIHASPLYAPYPFANAREEDFMPGPDIFSFDYVAVENGGAAVTIRCEVDPVFYAGDGFALLTVEPQGTLKVLFEREPKPATPSRPGPGPCAQQQTPPPCDSARPASEMQPTDALLPSLPRVSFPAQ